MVEKRIFVERVLDVPMTTYYGAGYTELDCCVDTRNVLQEISDTLREAQTSSHRGEGRRGRCCR